MTLVKKLTLLFILVPFLIKGQITQKVIEKFPSHILLRLDGLMQKVPLTPERQVHFAQIFYTQDSIAESLRKGHSTFEKIKSQYLGKEQILQILNPVERNDYIYVSDAYSDYFTVAIKRRRELSLTPDQIEKFLEAKTKVENGANETLNREEFNHRVLLLNLKRNQLIALLEFKNTKSANLFATKRWDRFDKAGLVTKVDSTKTYNTIKEYELRILVADQLYKIDKSPENAPLKEKAKSEMPLELRNLEIAYQSKDSPVSHPNKW